MGTFFWGKKIANICFRGGGESKAADAAAGGAAFFKPFGPKTGEAVFVAVVVVAFASDALLSSPDSANASAAVASGVLEEGYEKGGHFILHHDKIATSMRTNALKSSSSAFVLGDCLNRAKLAHNWI